MFDVHAQQSQYNIFSRTIRLYLLKTVHFKKTVAQSSFLADFVLISANMKTLLKEMRIAKCLLKTNKL